MARRRRRARNTNLRNIVLVAGGLAALALIVGRVSAATGDVTVNAEVYTKGSCPTNPQDDDPNDDHMFTYDVVWEYAATKAGEPKPYRSEQGRVGTITASAKTGLTKLNLMNPIVPIPPDIVALNPKGSEANEWSTSSCAPYYPCGSFINPSCCEFLSHKKVGDPVMISHVLIYRVLEDSCLDCHYTSCQPYGHTVPKGGGICAPFKYIRADGDCVQPSSSMCKKKLPYNPHGGCNYQDIYGPYTGKCYILIR